MSADTCGYARARILRARAYFACAPHIRWSIGECAGLLGRYVGVEAADDDVEPFSEKMQRLVAQWRA